ncbi:hypothetical protein [Nostoc sp. NMS9]|uniref:hypothetical protein n=1 Tax=Nostoc sp. NMS9 TaxID=2815393 RepID=UPI0025F461D0|nr:hypothetical protein [Nostoc sp. NMS9]MBN3939855.1 hypothetical protein [Nostoc sp. NMS9]
MEGKDLHTLQSFSSILNFDVRAIAGQNDINRLERAIAFLLWEGIALLVKGVRSRLGIS